MQGLMSSFPLSLPHAFHRVEQLFSDKTVVTASASRTHQMTYAEWALRTRLLASTLDELGVSRDGRVGTFAWNSARHLELYFAVPCTGRVLHTINIRLPPEQVSWIANHAEDEVIFVDRSLLGLLWPLLDELRTVRHLIVMDDETRDPIPDDPRVARYEQLLGCVLPAEFAVEDEQRAAAMCYTSGTTGRPKGVVYTHRSIMLHTMAVMAADTLAVSESDVILPVVPMFHVNAWGLPHAGVMAGASLVLPGRDVSGHAIASLLEAHDVTLAAGVPTIWQAVLPELEGRELPALGRIVCGGSAVPAGLSEAYRQRVGRPLLQAWGMTETSPVASVCRIKSTLREAPDEQLIARRATAGVPCPLVEARIVGPDSGEEQPWNGEATGELQVRGPWIAAGYHGGDGEDQFTTGGWMRTGDVARIDAHGYIQLVDRTKDLVKSGGEWISSVELENAIVAHPHVREAAVVAVPDERWGERPLACVVIDDGIVLTADDIRGFLHERVPKWWIPERVEFIAEIPKTSVGKFSKRELRDRYANHATL
jgi:fatty-acyl-CoA synthase